MTEPRDEAILDHPIRLADLGTKRLAFDVTPGPDRLAALAADLDLLDLRKLRFAGRLEPDGPRDWRLEATLGATVVQPCRVTLKPVTTRLDEAVLRRYLARWDEPAKAEAEMPEDDTAEPLPEAIDLGAVLAEALALALPPFPRADDAEETAQVFAGPGTAPMTDDDVKPFAGLANLRAKLKKDGE
ncbi:YceD family protein [Palleronia sp. KMU-117]|uniref:YceD family protein n=1 Tax=Palleronia sp. KMU-117 TaxID=3434108 RepID=UPI003D746E40